MRVKPQKPITTTSRVINPPQREENITILKPTSKEHLSKPKLPNIPSSTGNNINSFLPLLPKTPVSINFPSTTNSLTTNTANIQGTNSLTITPTVIYSDRSPSSVGNKRKRSIKSLDSNSEVRIDISEIRNYSRCKSSSS